MNPFEHELWMRIATMLVAKTDGSINSIMDAYTTASTAVVVARECSCRMVPELATITLEAIGKQHIHDYKKWGTDESPK